MFDYVRSVPVILPGESRKKQTEKYREARDNFDGQLAIIQVLMNYNSRQTISGISRLIWRTCWLLMRESTRVTWQSSTERPMSVQFSHFNDFSFIFCPLPSNLVKIYGVPFQNVVFIIRRTIYGQCRVSLWIGNNTNNKQKQMTLTYYIFTIFRFQI